jgi:hypothetical protein
MKYKLLILVLAFLFASNLKADELNTKKMEQVTKDILEVFVKDAGEKSNMLRKHISEEWLIKKNLNVKKYKINNYSPEYYNILYTGCDICVAVIGGASWAHLLVFKFTEENGIYRVVPMGISKASNDYIDPWWSVTDYVCSDKGEEDKEK